MRGEPHTLAPCAECPFRRGQSYLRPDRARAIATTHAVEGGGAIFWCHKQADGRRRGGKKHCGGALLFALRLGVWTQAMQLGARLGHYLLDRLRGKRLVYRSVEEMVQGHACGERNVLSGETMTTTGR